LSDEHPENACDSIRSSLEFDSNVNAESNRHSLKQDLPRIVTEEGIQIELIEAHPINACASIRSSLESDSNVNTDSD
jgi:hypothetical protein